MTGLLIWVVYYLAYNGGSGGYMGRQLYKGNLQ